MACIQHITLASNLYLMLTSHNTFSVTLLLGFDKLLSQVVSYVHITVHKQPDWMVEAQPHKIFNLRTDKLVNRFLQRVRNEDQCLILKVHVKQYSINFDKISQIFATSQVIPIQQVLHVICVLQAIRCALNMLMAFIKLMQFVMSVHVMQTQLNNRIGMAWYILCANNMYVI